MGKSLFAMMIPDREEMKSESEFWIMLMAISGIVSFIAFGFSKLLFGIIAENITINIREKLY